MKITMDVASNVKPNVHSIVA